MSEVSSVERWRVALSWNQNRNDESAKCQELRRERSEVWLLAVEPIQK